jgi:hypothetical protein
MATQTRSVYAGLSEMPFFLSSETSDRAPIEASLRPGRHSPKDQPQPDAWSANLDLTSERASAMSLLERAAEMGDESAFLEIAASLDWAQVYATDAAHIVHLALRAGAHLYAREFSARAAKRYPYVTGLKRMAAVLAPPRVVLRRPAQDDALKQNQCWLQAHAAEYRTLWVALRRGQLLASGTSLQGLRQAIADSAIPTADMLITRVD